MAASHLLINYVVCSYVLYKFKLEDSKIMSKYLGKGKMLPGKIEEEMLDSSWKVWSIGFDVHLKTVFVAVLIPDYTANTIQKFSGKYMTDYKSIQEMRIWLLDLKKNMEIQNLLLSQHQHITGLSSMLLRMILTRLLLIQH